MVDNSNAITGNRDVLFYLISAPLVIGFSLAYLWILIGWSALIGFFCMAVTFPIPTLLYLRYAKLQQAVMKLTDKRLGLIGELLNNASVFKYFAWECAMIAHIDEKRDAEQKMIWKRMSQQRTTYADFRRDNEYSYRFHQHSSPLNQPDCDPVYLHRHSKARVTFKYNFYCNHPLPNPRNAIYQGRNNLKINRQRTPSSTII
jgi:hypothetical protein